MENSNWPHDFWVPWLQPHYPYTKYVKFPTYKKENGHMCVTHPSGTGTTTSQTRKVVAISGYFNPIHQGHLDLIDAAAEYGDVYVILNNEKQRELKGSCPFYDMETRIRLLNSLKNVAGVVVSADGFEDVGLTLTSLRPDIFVNSGDRQEPNEMERSVCNLINCEMVHLDLPKRDSSSDILEKVFHWHKKEMLQ